MSPSGQPRQNSSRAQHVCSRIPTADIEVDAGFRRSGSAAGHVPYRHEQTDCLVSPWLSVGWTVSFQPEAIRAFEHAGWQRAASSYGNSFAHATAPFVTPLLDAAEVSAGQHVLDVACGPGDLAAAAVGRGAAAHGLDFSAEMVGIARSIHPDVVVTEGDAENLPYPDSIFDAVLSSFGIHHVPRPELALAQCCRVLKPGARVAFTVWATPEENIAWSLVFDAVDRRGNRSAVKAPSPGGSLNRIDQCLRILEATAFADRAAEIVRSEWLLPNGRALLAALSAGTARMAALLAAQEPSALTAIADDIDSHAERFRRDQHLAIPIAAVLARGRKAGD
jgi:SAM-dependent methyltransferase